MTETAAPETAAPSTNLPATRARTRTPRTSVGGNQHQRAAQQAVDANSTHLDFHVGATHVHVTMPPVDKLAFYAGLTGAAALGVIEWPIAVVTGIGHLLADDRRNRIVRALGEALDAA